MIIKLCEKLHERLTVTTGCIHGLELPSARYLAAWRMAEFAAQFIVRLTVLSMTWRMGPLMAPSLTLCMGSVHGSKHGPADDSAQGLTLISLSGTWFGAQFWARPLSPVTRRNGGAPRPLCVHSGLGTPPLFRPPLWRSAVVSGLRRCFEQAFGSRRGAGSGARCNSRGGKRHQGRRGKCDAVAR